jgi:hypothetical protein
MTQTCSTYLYFAAPPLSLLEPLCSNTLDYWDLARFEEAYPKNVALGVKDKYERYATGEFIWIRRVNT